MIAALGPDGRHAIDELLASAPLLAFDFDGTLAPIVSRPQDARVPLSVASRLRRLADRWPVAVVTGRAVADVGDRLGFDPAYIVGSHGADDPLDANRERWARDLDVARALLQAHQAMLELEGVTLEDKGQSLALHYRLAPDRARAACVARQVLQDLAGRCLVQAGKCVLNVMPADAPDKADAVTRLAERTGAGAALFAGDDLNDEPVFERAPPHWMTVRVGPDGQRSAARYFIDGPSQMAALLQALLDASQRIS